MKPLNWFEYYWIEIKFGSIAVFLFGAFCLGLHYTYKDHTERAYAAWCKYSGRSDITLAEFRILNSDGLLTEVAKQPFNEK